MTIGKAIAFGAALAAGVSAIAVSADAPRVSRPGAYSGYSPVRFDGWQLSSVYVPMRDGTRIAIDVIRPTKGGVVTGERLPVLWMNSPYNRRPKGGKSAAETYPSGPLELVKHGYVVAVADFRGLYASFGRDQLFNVGEWVEPAWTDAYDVTEWLARQPWSSGKIGMWGCSATAGSQMQAAVTRPPSLKAIFPLSTVLDTYRFQNLGGAPSSSPARPMRKAERDVAGSPVDGPDGAALMEQAIAEHTDVAITQSGLPFRDSRSAELGEWWKRSSPATYLTTLRASGIAMYTGGSWDESSTKSGPAEIFANMPKGRAKLIFGPHGHCGWEDTAREDGLRIQVEQLRFFDYWLKGIDNGIMAEPAVTYYTYNAPAGTAWRQSRTWPLANERRMPFYLSSGALAPRKPAAAGREQAAMGALPKATSIELAPPAGGLAFETPPLPAALQVTGYPVVSLWLSSEAGDADVVAQLVDVAPDGSTRSYHMVGRLRASHRKPSDPPYAVPGLPWHSHLSSDADPLPAGRPAQVRFAMLPMSYIFPKGHRIRLGLTFSNPDVASGAVTVWTGAATASRIDLPVIPARRQR